MKATATTDVFYAFCTFWTGDWAWLAKKNGAARRAREPALPEPLARALAQRGITIRDREDPGVQPWPIPHCPFCGSVGFQISRDEWLEEAREWEAGTSPNAPGVSHPGYVAMLLWGEKKCFPNYDALEAAWRAGT